MVSAVRVLGAVFGGDAGHAGDGGGFGGVCRARNKVSVPL